MDWTLIKPFIAGQVRHVVSVVAGALIASGAVASDDRTVFVNIGTGMVMWAIAAAWDWWQKEGQKQMLATLAKMKPVASENAPTNVAAKAAIKAANNVK